MKLRNHTPCRYSRFIYCSGVSVALGLFLASALLGRLALYTHSTTRHIRYITTGRSCIEAAFAALVCVLIAAAIGEAVFRKHPE